MADEALDTECCQLRSEPGWTFSIDEHGYAGLMKGKKAAVVYTSGTFAQSRGSEFG